MGIGKHVVAGVIAGGIVVTCTAGIATAAGGKSVLLGQSNKSFKATSLRAAGGPALTLRGASGSPDFAVHSTRQIAKLNASYLDGLTAKQLQAGPVVTQVLGQMVQGDGVALCPAGTKPVGGGVLPDATGTSDTDIPFVVASYPHLKQTATGGVVTDGWEGVASDFDGTYTGGGFVFAMCEAGKFIQTTSAQPARKAAQATRSHAATAR